MLYYDILETPMGRLFVVADEHGLRQVDFADAGAGSELPQPDPQWQHDPQRLRPACEQLRAYFAGRRQAFDLPLAPQGTPFQQQVWRALCEIPYGETISYGELARRIGKPTSSRAVGAANGQNPIAIIIPCHRVIGANGKLTGYAGGLHRKEFLLGHERRHDSRPLVLAARD